MKPIPIYARQTVILEEFIDRTFNVYNGRTFELLRVSPEMVGLRFGDFVFTKQMTTLIHKEKINKKK